MRHAHATHEIMTFLFRLCLYYPHDKTRQDVGYIFRSGYAEWREAMQRIVVSGALPQTNDCLFARTNKSAGACAETCPAGTPPRLLYKTE